MLSILFFISVFIIPIFCILGMFNALGWWTGLIAPVCYFIGFLGAASENEDDLVRINLLKNMNGTKNNRIPLWISIVIIVRKIQIFCGPFARLVCGIFGFYQFYYIYDYDLFISLLIMLPCIWARWLLSSGLLKG